MSTIPPFPSPVPGASLLLAFKPVSRTILIIGAHKLAAARAFAALEAGAHVVVASTYLLEKTLEEIQWRSHTGQIRYVQLQEGASSVPESPYSDEEAIGDLLESLGNDLALVCVTDCLMPREGARRRTADSARRIYDLCRRLRLPVNTADMPLLCDFTFPSTHRFAATSSSPTQREEHVPSLQLAVTTNGHGCRLASRIQRYLSSKLPPTLGDAVANIANLRSIAKGILKPSPENEYVSSLEFAPLNAPVPQFASHLGSTEEPAERTRRRMRWVNQISEYWPLDKLAVLKADEMKSMLENIRSQEEAPSIQPGFSDTPSSESCGFMDPIDSHHDLPLSAPRCGQILLVGSGTGHPSLLTVAAHRLLTSSEGPKRVLSDKLVPAEVLALIPKSVPVYIAKKYPGNSDGAQNELMEMAVEGARKGETVIRLKQGDPYLYGRGGEEVLYFRSQGFEPIVIPGISSALAGPCFAGIPVTQRGVAESLIICTGVGRMGKTVTLPPYERSRTLVVLMGVARLAVLLKELREHEGNHYPGYLPIAIVERASSPDQRLIAATLDTIQRVLDGPEVGELRSPGMIVIGWVVLALEKSGDLEVLDDALPAKLVESNGGLDTLDEARVSRWLEGKPCVIRDGLSPEWIRFQ